MARPSPEGRAFIFQSRVRDHILRIVKAIGLFALTFLAAGGCYKSVPLASSPLREGSELEVRLIDSRAPVLADLVGNRATVVRGRYLGTTADSLRLGVLGITKQDGTEDFWKGERVALSRADIATINVRKLSGSRTAMLLAVSGVGLYFAKLGFEGRTNSTNGKRFPPAGP
jgi:hypothetical protein